MEAKVIDMHSASVVRKWADMVNGKVVFTNGCFDLFHPGHMLLLEHCKAWNDNEMNVVVVGLNSDSSVRRLKGPDRPFYSEGERIMMLEGNAYVDYIILFHSESVLPLIEAVKPDVLVKGGTTEKIEGQEYVESYGGVVSRSPKFGNHSTTSIAEKLNVQNIL
jgi:rfaE bifunctional protein nucleotidyltransferase chain/domain